MGKANAEPDTALTPRRAGSPELPTLETPVTVDCPASGFLTTCQILIASVFGAGFIPVAPATFASAIAVLAVGVIPKSVLVYSVFTALLFLLGVRLAGNLEYRWGHDARRITIDEFVGILVSFWLVPYTLWSALAGFFLFRFFDILKLPFVRRAEQLPGGWGVMADDVFAGVCTNIILQLVFRLLWPVGAPSWRLW